MQVLTKAQKARKLVTNNKWRRAHPDKVQAQQKRYRTKYKEKIAIYNAQYKKTHKELVRKIHNAYVKNNPKKTYNWIQKYTHAPKHRCVYSVSCIPTGKIYIGSSICVGQRLSNFKWRLKVGDCPSPGLQRDYNLYGEKNIEYRIIACLGNVASPAVRRQEQIEIDKIPPHKRYNMRKVCIY